MSADLFLEFFENIVVFLIDLFFIFIIVMKVVIDNYGDALMLDPIVGEGIMGFFGGSAFLGEYLAGGVSKESSSLITSR